MKKYAITLALSAVFAFVSCNDANKKTEVSEETAKTVSITHPLGTDEAPENPQRLVVLNFATLENLDLIDANVVGIPKQALPKYLSHYADDNTIANVGSLVEVNLEKINELDPELIISGTRLSESYKSLSRIAPTLYTHFDMKDPLGALKKDLDVLGKLFEKQELYDKAYAELEEKVARAKEKIAGSDAKALIVLHNKGRFSAYGSGSRFGLVHDVLGVKEAAPGLETHLHGTRASSEFIQETNPDILFVVDRSAAIGDTPLNKSEVENDLIKRTNAYKNGKIVYLNSEAWYLSGTGGLKSINLMVDEISGAFDDALVNQ